MKVGIVIPLKAKTVSKNWSVTCENVESTVGSVLAQKDNRYRSIVVGHDKPGFMDELNADEKCIFKEFTELQPPEVGENEMDNQQKYEVDRCMKILKGIMELKKHHPDITYWFALDADDLVHDEFIQVLQSYDEVDAIILNKGYFLFKNTGIINNEDGFSAYCGSSAVLSDKLFDLPEKISDNTYRSIPFGAISHVHMEKRLSDKGCSIKVPTERLIMYVRDNGENISNAAYCNTHYKKFKKFLKMLLRAKRVSSQIRNSFGIS